LALLQGIVNFRSLAFCRADVIAAKAYAVSEFGTQNSNVCEVQISDAIIHALNHFIYRGVWKYRKLQEELELLRMIQRQKEAREMERKRLLALEYERRRQDRLDMQRRIREEKIAKERRRRRRH
jgi:hypothetical protein